MTDQNKVYTKTLKKLKQMMELSHQRPIITLEMAITGYLCLD